MGGINYTWERKQPKEESTILVPRGGSTQREEGTIPGGGSTQGRNELYLGEEATKEGINYRYLGEEAPKGEDIQSCVMPSNRDSDISGGNWETASRNPALSSKSSATAFADPTLS